MSNIFNGRQYIPITLFLLRIVAGIMFLQIGGTKILGWFGRMPGGGAADLMSQIGIGGILEVAGGIAIVLGLFTRPVAFVLAGEMAVAYWQFHAPDGTWPIENNGQLSVLFCFVFLFFAAYGAGEWSVDGILKRNKGK